MCREAGERMVELLSDMETLLASDRHFLLGTWLSDALSYASDMKESFLMQNNARNQITIWGPDGEVCSFQHSCNVVCLPACLPACLSVCLSVCLFIGLLSSLPNCLCPGGLSCGLLG